MFPCPKHSFVNGLVDGLILRCHSTGSTTRRHSSSADGREAMMSVITASRHGKGIKTEDKITKHKR